MYKTSYPLIDSFYIYLNKDQSAILPTTVRTKAFAYETLHMSDTSLLALASYYDSKNFERIYSHVPDW